LTSTNQLEVLWDFLTHSDANGGSPILSYGLELSDDGGSYVVVAGVDPVNAPYTLNSLVIKTAIKSGSTYKLKYRAYNVHGWGDYSTEGTLVASTIPDAPAAPTFAMDGTDVKISWTPPTDTGGLSIEIIAYKIEIP
jgi:hypothetical protein